MYCTHTQRQSSCDYHDDIMDSRVQAAQSCGEMKWQVMNFAAKFSTLLTCKLKNTLLCDFFLV